MLRTIALFALSLGVSAPALAQYGYKDTHCGEILFDRYSQITAIRATRSSNRNVIQVITKTGSHKINFTFGDAPEIYRHTQAAINAINYNRGNHRICMDVWTTQVSQWGTPIEARIATIYNYYPN